MDKNLVNQLSALATNPEANEKLEKAESIVEVIAIAAEYGVVVTENDLTGVLVPASGEFTENDLEAVTGGASLKSIWSHIKSFFKGLANGYDNYVS